VDVLRSLSRTMPGCLEPAQRELVARARAALALQQEMAELVRLGAYRAGTDPGVDAALRIAPRIEALLRQGRGEPTAPEASFAMLAEALADAGA
jgi:flagellum-specific ATP synthase